MTNQSLYLRSNAIWTWFNRPVAAWSSGSLYAGWLESDGDVVVGKITPSATVPTLSLLTVKATLEVDDHDNPAICVLSSGKILACYSAHNGASYSRRSTNAADVSAWDAEVATGATADAYAQVFQMGDTAETVLWFFRRGASNPRPTYFRTSTDDGDNWNAAVEFFGTASHRPYFVVTQASSTRLDFAFTDGQPNETSNNIYHCYMTIAADGTRSFFKSDGTGLGALPYTGTDLTEVYDGSSANSWVWDIRYLSSSPVIAFSVFPNSGSADYAVHEYHLARWTGSAWTTEKICDGGTGATADYLYAAEAQYSGGVSIDPDDTGGNTVWVSREYGSGDFRVEKWVKSGGTWAKSIDASGDTDNINARPVATGSGVTLWWSGTYTSYTSYLANLFAYADWTVFSRDTFTSSANTELTARVGELATWVKHGNATSNAQTTASSGRLRGVTGSSNANYYTAQAPASADYYCECDVYCVATGEGYAVGPSVREYTSEPTFYHARFSQANARWELYRFSYSTGSLVATLLGTASDTISAAASKTCRLTATGTGATVSLTVAVNGTDVISYSDTDATRIVAAGRPGFRLATGSSVGDGNGLQIDNFKAGNPNTAKPWYYYMQAS